ncbi:MAG TPA: outer membrane beta-barrel protein [Phnomibacter sp.]|nr:outer membrane beta-barrel protein [Phnomibacter sp.]
MKILLTPAALLLAALTTHAQTDTTRTQSEKPDTIRIGGMIIINKKGSDTGTVRTDDGHASNVTIRYERNRNKQRRLTTSWLNFDYGFANYNDMTNYGSAAAQEYARPIRTGEPNFTESDLRLKTGRSSNFNLWFVKQRYGITRDNKFNVKWGLMLETNNYRYEEPISYSKNTRPFLFRDSVSFTRNKLAMDYFSIPVLIGFNSRPGRDNGFNIGGGVSIGYLASSRSKQKSGERGKEKNKGNFDLEPWKFQYVGEIGLGIVKLYGSYAPRSVYTRGLDIRPYTVGLRFGEW